MARLPDRMRSQIRELTSLVAQLEVVINQIPIGDTISLELWLTFESRLRVAEALLPQLLRRVRQQLAAAQESGPRTSGTLGLFE